MRIAGKLSAHVHETALFAYCPSCRSVFVDDISIEGSLACPSRCKIEKDFTVPKPVLLERGLSDAEAKRLLAVDTMRVIQRDIDDKFVRVIDVETESGRDGSVISLVLKMTRTIGEVR